jgi:hypothetical protein
LADAAREEVPAFRDDGRLVGLVGSLGRVGIEGSTGSRLLFGFRRAVLEREPSDHELLFVIMYVF